MKSLLILPLTILLIVGCGEKKADNKLKFGHQVWFGIRTGSGQEIIRGENSISQFTSKFWYISETENIFKLREQDYSGGAFYVRDKTFSKRNINWLTRTDVQKPMPELTQPR